MLKFLNNYAEEIISAVLLAIMASTAFINVIVRYCSNLSFAWTEELTINLFVWVVLLGTSAVFRHGGHLGMNLLYNSFPKKIRFFCLVLILAVGFVFFSVLGWYGYLEVIDEIELEAISESLGIPVWWYTISIPLLSVLIIFRMLQRFFIIVRSGKY